MTKPLIGPRRAALLSGLCLAGTALADPVTISAHSTLALQGTLLTQDSPPASSGTVETFLEKKDPTYGNRLGMSSALAQDDGHLEVGAEVAMGLVGRAVAVSNHLLEVSNPDPLKPGDGWVELHIMPGEILFRDTGSFDLPTLPGRYTGTLSYLIEVERGNGSIETFLDCRLQVVTIRKSWDLDAVGSTDCGIDLLESTYFGENDLWGLTTRGQSIGQGLVLGPGETVTFHVSMTAEAQSNFVDWPGLLSVKFGDPLDAQVGPGFSVTFGTVDQKLPAPASAALAALALLALALNRRGPRPDGPTTPSRAVAPSRRASAAGSGVARLA